jgi:hypothetical protein
MYVCVCVLAVCAVSDSQSFPMQSTSAPKLWEGAYSADERYTQDDIAAVVEYARLRGVRVMVECTHRHARHTRRLPPRCAAAAPRSHATAAAFPRLPR